MPTRFDHKYRPRVSVDESGEQVIDLRDLPERHRKRSGRLPGRTHPTRLRPADVTEHAQLRQSKFFGSPAFRRLWFSQFLSSMGDWIGLVAITAIANDVGGNFAMGAVSLVLAARLIPGLFLSPFAGVLVDRLNRKRIMVSTDFGRALVLCSLVFWQNLPILFVCSLLLELMTLLWSPAKEATVPNIVRRSFLPSANSMSLAAAYGSLIPAMVLYTVLIKVPDWLGQSEHFYSVNLSDDAVLLFFDALTYILSALVIATLAIPHRHKKPKDADLTSSGNFRQALEGWKLVASNYRVRTVIVGMAVGLIGGGVIVPLGPAFATDALGAGKSGYGLLMVAMGIGTALGVVAISVFQKRLPIERTFVAAILGAGVCLAVAAGMSGLGAAAAVIGGLGIFAGTIYVLGFTILQTSVTDEFRGRIFAAFYTVTRLSLLAALLTAPLITLFIDNIDTGVPGVRITLWIGAAIIIFAGILAARPMRRSLETPA